MKKKKSGLYNGWLLTSVLSAAVAVFAPSCSNKKEDDGFDQRARVQISERTLENLVVNASEEIGAEIVYTDIPQEDLKSIGLEDGVLLSYKSEQSLPFVMLGLERFSNDSQVVWGGKKTYFDVVGRTKDYVFLIYSPQSHKSQDFEDLRKALSYQLSPVIKLHKKAYKDGVYDLSTPDGALKAVFEAKKRRDYMMHVRLAGREHMQDYVDMIKRDYRGDKGNSRFVREEFRNVSPDNCYIKIVEIRPINKIVGYNPRYCEETTVAFEIWQRGKDRYLSKDEAKLSKTRLGEWHCSFRF